VSVFFGGQFGVVGKVAIIHKKIETNLAINLILKVNSLKAFGLYFWQLKTPKTTSILYFQILFHILTEFRQ
jgi:hypothetical protein